MFNDKKIFIILFLPLLLTSCARAQGALAPIAQSLPTTNYPPTSGQEQFLPNVEPASLEPIINYVDGLNLALSGEFLYLRSTALANCGCLEIADRLEKALKSVNLIGGHYQLRSIKLEKDGDNQKSFKVVVDRSDIRRVDKFNHQSTLWSASKITNTFIVKKVAGVWLLSDTK